MSRIRLMMVAVAVAAGVVGCAQCDTCDDFPTPCNGPNCGRQGGIMDSLAPTMSQGAPVMGASTPTNPPMDDSAGPGPSAPMPDPARTPMTPPVDPTSPPPPMDSTTRPN